MLLNLNCHQNSSVLLYNRCFSESQGRAVEYSPLKIQFELMHGLTAELPIGLFVRNLGFLLCLTVIVGSIIVWDGFRVWGEVIWILVLAVLRWVLVVFGPRISWKTRQAYLLWHTCTNLKSLCDRWSATALWNKGRQVYDQHWTCRLEPLRSHRYCVILLELGAFWCLSRCDFSLVVKDDSR